MTAKITLIDTARGRNRREHGPDMSGEADPQDYVLPEFTVPRIGGGQLHWADNAGKSVVVDAGDVTHVAPVVRRLAKLTSGGKSPAVTGLIWDPFGDKEHPTSTAMIKRRAGRLPRPSRLSRHPCGGLAPGHVGHQSVRIRSDRIPGPPWCAREDHPFDSPDATILAAIKELQQ
jgi:hypothetical protein